MGSSVGIKIATATIPGLAGHVHHHHVSGNCSHDLDGLLTSVTACTAVSSTPSTHTPSPGTLASFAVEGTTLAFGVVGVFSVAGIALMLLRRR